MIDGLRSLVHNPERAAWQFSPQHYLITHDCNGGEQEAILLYRQGDTLAHTHQKVILESPSELIERKRKSRNPYHVPGHLVAMDVKLDSEDILPNEPIIHELTIRTAKTLKTRPNRDGFQVSKLEDTTLLRSYEVTLPSSYRELFQQRKELRMYNCIIGEGQDIVLFTIRPLDHLLKSDVKWPIEWMTLPELLGTFGESSFEIFRTSIKVTTAMKQQSASRSGAKRGEMKLRETILQRRSKRNYRMSLAMQTGQVISHGNYN